MSMRWLVKGIPLEGINHHGGAVGEPFAAIQLETGTIVLTKEVVMYEGDEERSSVLEENRQVERERG